MVAGCSYTTSWLLRNQSDILLILSLHLDITFFTSRLHLSLDRFSSKWTCKLAEHVPKNFEINSLFKPAVASSITPISPMEMCVQSIIYMHFFFNSFHDSYTSCSLLLFFPPFLSVFSVAHQISILHTVFLASSR